MEPLDIKGIMERAMLSFDQYLGFDQSKRITLLKAEAW